MAGFKYHYILMMSSSMNIDSCQELKILILEDSLLDVELIRLKLKNDFSFKDKVIYQKENFINELNSFKPDIILSDYSMPQFTGLEALSMLKESDYICPFIIITGALDEETAVACIKAGADDYLLKDRMVRLAAAIKQSLHQHNVEKEKEKARLKLENTQFQLRELLNRLENVRDEEKKRISMEIHDQLGQELTASKLGLIYIEKNLLNQESLSETEKLIIEKVKELVNLSTNTLKTVRKIAHQLRPVVLDDLGLVAAIESMINSVTKNAEICWVLENELEDLRFKHAFVSSIYRVVQESITNVLRHSQASDCELLLKSTRDKLHIYIIDNGIGFDLKSAKNKGKLGIFGMEERLIPWKGSLSIESIVNQGTEVHITLPLHSVLK